MTLDDLRRAAELLPPGSALTLSREALLGALETSNHLANGNGNGNGAGVDEVEQWLTAEECAARLHVSTRWCYDHAKQLGARRLSRRCVRFSSLALAKYMARKG